MSSFYGYWGGTEFTQGDANAVVNDNGDGTYTIVWDALFNTGRFIGKTGEWTVTIQPTDLIPITTIPLARPILHVTQDMIVNPTMISTLGGDVTITADFGALVTAGFTWTWSADNHDIFVEFSPMFQNPNFLVIPAESESSQSTHRRPRRRYRC